jgi:hypothetical protein
MGNWRGSRDVSVDVIATPIPCNGSSPNVTDVTPPGERSHTLRGRVTSCFTDALLYRFRLWRDSQRQWSGACGLGYRWHSHFGLRAFQFLAVVVPEERRALNRNAELHRRAAGEKDEEGLWANSRL